MTSPTMIPVPPCIIDSHNIAADFPFPSFCDFASALQIGILRNRHLLRHYIGVAAHNFPVYASPATTKLFAELSEFIRDRFPTIFVETLARGLYGSVTVTPQGAHPTISVSRDLVRAFETGPPDSEDFPKLGVIVATTLLHELSHAIQTFFWGSKSPICLARAGKKEGESGWLLEDTLFRGLAGVYFKAEKDEGRYSRFRGIYLRNPDDPLKIHVPDNDTCLCWINSLMTGNDPAWDLEHIPLQGDKEASFFRSKTLSLAACQMVNNDAAHPPSSPSPPSSPPPPGQSWFSPQPSSSPSPSQSPTSTSRSPSTSPSPSPPPAPPKVPFSISNDQMLDLLTALIEGDKRSNMDILSHSPRLGPVFDEDYFKKMLVECNFPTEVPDPNGCRPSPWTPPQPSPLVHQPSVTDKPDVTRYASNPTWCGRKAEIAPSDMEGV